MYPYSVKLPRILKRLTISNCKLGSGESNYCWYEWSLRGCLILYDKIQRFDILQQTFPELIVTKEVADEYGELPDWVVVKEVSDKAKYAELTDSLGKGEASSIALALESENSLLIIDEKKERKIAEDM